MTLLSVSDLRVEFPTRNGPLCAVDGVSFDLESGGTLGIVGESGSGKTVTALAIAGLVGLHGGQVTGGSVLFDGRELVGMSNADRSNLLGKELGLIFQQASRSLDPTMKVGAQIAEVVRRHEHVGRKAAWARAVEMLDRVEIPNASTRAHDYPHTFSGGMSQRVMVAMALVCRPRLVIADEPTTALDVTVQSKVLEFFAELQRELGLAVILISHDLGVVLKVCRRIAVMYLGQLVETGSADDVLRAPRHPYTSGLLLAVPQRGTRRQLIAVPGVVPPLDALPAGCRFHTRCEYSEAGRCDEIGPALREANPGRADRCLRSDELNLPGANRHACPEPTAVERAEEL